MHAVVAFSPDTSSIKPQLSSRRVLPHNQEAEESVIGGILFNGRTFSQVVECVDATDFYHDPLKAIFEAMIELDQISQPIDIITVSERMRQNNTMGKLKAYNGEAYLADLATRIATVENITYWAQIVKEKAIARRLIEGATQVVEKGYTDYPDVNEYVDEAQQIIFDIANRSNRQGYEAIRKVIHTTIRLVENRTSQKEAVTGIPTGYERFDELTAGFQPGELVIIAARPSMGKTAFALNCIQNAAIKHKIPSLIFSLEMSKESLVERMLCGEAHLDSQKLRRGILTGKEWIDLTKYAGLISEAPIWIDDSGSPTLMEIRAKCRRWRSDPNIFKQGISQMGIIVVDYLQLIQGRSQGKDSNREREISEISRGLKGLAKELSVPVVALSQLNRSVESRADKRPVASDLRESGALEQDADLICFIYRDEVYNKETKDKGIAELIIGKQRSGPTGLVRLEFVHNQTRFKNLPEGRKE